jgi:2-methylcitrate dehydratase
MLSIVARTGSRTGRVQQLSGASGTGSLRSFSLRSTRPAVLGNGFRPSATLSILKPLNTRAMSQNYGESTVRPEADKVIQDIADYVHNYRIDSELAMETARLCLIDTIGCGLEALRFPGCTSLLGPVVEGTVVPNGEQITILSLVACLPLLQRHAGARY